MQLIEPSPWEDPRAPYYYTTFRPPCILFAGMHAIILRIF